MGRRLVGCFHGIRTLINPLIPISDLGGMYHPVEVCVGWREHPKAFGAFMMERGRGVFAATFDPRTDDASSSFAFPLSPFSQRIKNSQSLLFDASIER